MNKFFPNHRLHVTHSNDSIRHVIIEHVIKHINTSDDDIVRWRIHEIYTEDVCILDRGFLIRVYMLYNIQCM